MRGGWPHCRFADIERLPVKCLPQGYEDRVQTRSPFVNAVHGDLSQILHQGQRDRMISRVHWSASLASFKFNEVSVSKSQNIKERRRKTKANGNLQVPWSIIICTHTKVH